VKARSAKAKGNLLEDWIVGRLHETGLDPRAYRQLGSGSGKRKGDIWNALQLCIEAKNQKNFSPAWYRELLRDKTPEEQPVLVWHPPRVALSESVVVMPWAFLEELLKVRKDGNG
jgi:hypothetical protein